MVVVISLVERDPVSFFRWVPTLSNYRSLFDPITARVFVNSLEYSTVTTVLTLAIGYPFAWFLARVSAHRRSLLLMMVMVPFWTSSLIRTYALVILMKANGRDQRGVDCPWHGQGNRCRFSTRTLPFMWGWCILCCRS